MAVVLAATGAFVYVRTESDLDDQIARQQAVRLAGAIAILRDDGDDLGDPVADPLGRLDDFGSIQVLGPGREVVDATAESLQSEPLIDGPATSRLIAAEGEAMDVESPVGPLRVAAGRTQDDGVRYVAIVGTPLSERNRTLESLERVLLIGGPIALLLASLAAYWVATAALRPVEAMQRRAAAISVDDPAQRLPAGDADDEIAHLAATLNDLLGRLAGAIEQERRFVADASHELRTPLAILHSEVELALAEGRSPAELRDALGSISDEVDRLIALADDLLVLSRADEGRLPLHPQPVRIGELVDRVRRGLGSALDGRAIEASIQPDLTVEADPTRLEQALTNLVANSLAHGSGPIAIEATGESGVVRISVRDDGPGFPPGLLESATERFARGDGRRDPSGAGLGLAIVRSIAEAHGGMVEVGNRPGGGALVTISLPRESPSTA